MGSSGEEANQSLAVVLDVKILARKRSITADIALRFSRYFGNSAEFWLNLQIQYALRQARLENADVYNQIPLAVVS